jgi:plastocyanin
MKKLVILLVIIIAIGGAYFILKGGSSENLSDEEFESKSFEDSQDISYENSIVHRMSLGEVGYEPRDITISVGDSIEFSTTGDKPYWPASNVHPTHRIYPDFDPKEPIQPEDNWQFTFDKEGEWRYHDHLAPFYTGVITVVPVKE